MRILWVFVPAVAVVGVALALGGRGPASSKPQNGSLMVPKALVAVQNGTAAALVVDKSRAIMDLYSNQDGIPQKARTFRIASGKKHGNKLFQGDNRTPEGIYFFSEHKPQNVLAPKYGVGAFVMDYPNIFDLLQNKTGGGIWLHGTNQEYRVDEKFDSEGCVVVENQDFHSLASVLQINSTPIVIYNEVPLVPVSELADAREKFLGFVEDWRSAWEGKRIDDYMRHYSEKMFHSGGRNWSSWRAYKNSLNQSYDSIVVALRDIRAYQFHPYAYIDFVQTYSSPVINDTGRKRLGLYFEGGEWRIISETYFKIDQTGHRKISSESTSAPKGETL